MNKRLVLRLLGAILLIEALAMAPSLAISLLYGDGDALALLSSMALLAALGFPAWRFARPREQNLRAREGFLVVALSWVLLSAFGALPFVISGLIPNYIDAFFEAVSGFTTTGATLMGNFDGRAGAHPGAAAADDGTLLAPGAGGKPRSQPEQDRTQDGRYGQDPLPDLRRADHDRAGGAHHRGDVAL